MVVKEKKRKLIDWLNEKQDCADTVRTECTENHASTVSRPDHRAPRLRFANNQVPSKLWKGSGVYETEKAPVVNNSWRLLEARKQTHCLSAVWCSGVHLTPTPIKYISQHRKEGFLGFLMDPEEGLRIVLTTNAWWRKNVGLFCQVFH